MKIVILCIPIILLIWCLARIATISDRRAEQIEQNKTDMKQS